MAKEREQFLNKLSCQIVREEQEEKAKEIIRSELFKIIDEFDLENGKVMGLNQAVELIATRLGIQDEGEQLSEYITQVLKSGKYQYCITDKGNIISHFNKFEKSQKIRNDKMTKDAIEQLQAFVEKVELYCNQLIQQKNNITSENLKNQFSIEDQKNNGIWIDLAIDKVLKSRNQER